MKTHLRMKCKACGHWNKVPVNKIFLKQPNPIEPKISCAEPIRLTLEKDFE